MHRFAAAAMLAALSALAQAAPAAETARLPFDTYSGYFVSNQFEPDAAASFMVITGQKEFDKTFGVAFVMGDRSRRLPKDVFQSSMVVAAVKRGNAVVEYQVEGVSTREGVVELKYRTTSTKSDTATFACPLIVSIPKGKYQTIEFVEDGKVAKRLEIGGSAPSPRAVQLRKVDASRVDISLTGDGPFPVNVVLVLRIGRQQTNISRYAKNRPNTVVFSMPTDDFAKTNDGDPITVRYPPGVQGRTDFGVLDKSKVVE